MKKNLENFRKINVTTVFWGAICQKLTKFKIYFFKCLVVLFGSEKTYAQQDLEMVPQKYSIPLGQHHFWGCNSSKIDQIQKFNMKNVYKL